ncbi:MAG: hypothetical protein R3Y59_10575 [bacterium]
MKKKTTPPFVVTISTLIPIWGIMWSDKTKLFIASIFPDLSKGMIGALNALLGIIVGIIIGSIAVIAYVKITELKSGKDAQK